MNEAIKSMISQVAAGMVKDIQSDDFIGAMFVAYQFMQREERNYDGYIYDIHKRDSVSMALGNGLDPDDLYKLAEKAKDMGHPGHFIFNEMVDEPYLIDYKKAISDCVREIATCVVCYPYIEEYRPLYTRYVTDAMLTETQNRFTDILNFCE
jgi:hypothetical protein